MGESLMLPLDENCLDRWLEGYDAFREDFLRFCYTFSKACGYYPQVNFGNLKIAHQAWVAETQVWES